jgi:hypothetical protein
MNTEAVKQAIAQKYGPVGVTFIDTVAAGAQHYLSIISIQAKGTSRIIIAQVLRINRGWEIQLYEQSFKVFKPS